MKKNTIILCGLSVFGMLTHLATSNTVWADDNNGPRIDVACNGTSFSYQGPEHGPGVPAYGASFVVQGVIYPSGTLNETNGLNADGTPEFPDKVIGTWTCSGHFIGNGFLTNSGAFVVTSQNYELQGRRGRHSTLVSSGTELIDINVPFRRAVTGGTHRFRGASGQVIQTAIGANATGLFNFRFRFDLEDD